MFDFISRTTPTGGKDQNFLGQLLTGAGKIGRAPRRASSAAADSSRWPTPTGRIAVQTKNPRDRSRGFFVEQCAADQPCASTASSSSATMLVILIAGLTAGPAVSL